MNSIRQPSIRQPNEVINIVKDGRVGKFCLRIQGQPLVNVPAQLSNEAKDVWIYKGASPAGGSQGQSVTPSHLVKSQQKPLQMVTPSKNVIVSPPSRMVTIPKLMTSSKSPIIRVTVPPTKSNFTRNKPPTPPPPPIIDPSPKPLQVPSCEFVDLDNLHNVSLVDIDEDSIDSDLKIGEFQCDECGADFTSQSELEKHEHSHLGEVNYICDQCGKEFSTKKFFEDHIKMHAAEKKFECDACHKKFDYRDNLIFHMRIHGNMKTYKCHICHKMFGNKSMLDIHLKKHTAQNPSLQSLVHVESGRKVTFVVKNKEVLFKCDVCPKCFTDKNSLETHKMSHIPFVRGPKLKRDRNPPPAKTVNKTNPVNKTSQVPLKLTRKHKCPKCDRVFLKEHYYKCHVAICVGIDGEYSSNKNSVTCSFCKKYYIVPSQAKEDESQSMKFICEPCCTFLAQKSQFSGFTPRLENRFICNKCDKCFANEEQLRKHLNSHLPDKVFRCQKCDQCFANDKSLAVHIQSHYSRCKKTHFDDDSSRSKDTKKSANKERNSPQKSSNSKRTKPSNHKSGKKGSSSELSKEPRKRNNEEELPGLSEKSGRKRHMSSSEETKKSHSPLKRGKMSTGIAGARDDLDDGMSDPYSDIDINKTASGEPFMEEEEEEEEEEGLPNFQVFIKQEPDDFDGPEYDVMENCTVFNAAISREKTRAAFNIPDKTIKKDSDSSDDDDIGKIPIKLEKESDDEMTIKEEHDFDFLGFSVKDEKLDDDDPFMQDEFEFTPFGDPVKTEDLIQ